MMIDGINQSPAPLNFYQKDIKLAEKWWTDYPLVNVYVAN